MDEAEATGALITVPCADGLPECTGIGAPTNPPATTTTAVPGQPGSHFFENGVPTILELSDNSNLDCIVLDAQGRAVLTTDKTKCLVVTPFATGGGYRLAIGDVTDPLDTDCLMRDGNIGLMEGPCDTRPEFLITDLPGAVQATLQFPIRGVGVISPCLTRTGPTLSFASCGPTSSQLWYDTKKAPRTDPCVGYNPAPNAPRPARQDFADYQYNTGPVQLGDIYNQGLIAVQAVGASFAGPLHRELASKLLLNYLGLDNRGRRSAGAFNGQPVVLTQRDMSRILGLGFGSAGRNIPEFLRLDVSQAAALVPPGNDFRSGGLGPVDLQRVTKFTHANVIFNRSGESKSGVLTAGEIGMNVVSGWFRVAKSPNPNVLGDYPDNGDAGIDVVNGVGSYDLRIQGRIIQGFTCFKVFLTDYYAFEPGPGPAGAVGSFDLTNLDMAKLNKVGLARNFDIFGEYVTTCFIPPTENRIRCPGHPKLG